MTPIKTLTAVAAGALAISAAGAARAQTPYTSTPYGQTQPQTPQDAFGAILGALFGTNQTQTLDSQWSRGRRPLGAGSAQFDTRLQAGVRNGSISSREAGRLGADYQALVQLEARYTADGRVTAQERAELNERYRTLSQRVDTGGYGYDDDGYDDGRWEPLIDRRAEFDVRVDAALRARALNRTEAARLRADYQALVQIETGYMRNGLDARELADLRLRYDDLERRLGDDDGYDDDRNAGRWAGIEARIAAGERNGAIDRIEAERLRTELGDLTRLDAAYVRDGLNADERTYLTRRFGELSARVRAWRY